MGRDELLEVANAVCDAVAEALADLHDWGLAGTRPGQYRSDLAADSAAVAVLEGAGLGVLSEESGLHSPDRELLAVLDPLDGSTNASRRLPWYATSCCVLDAEGPLAAVVRNQATGTNYEAVRGGGARRDGEAIRPSEVTEVGRAVVGLSGYPPRHLGWRQYRALGAVALDLCAVADGSLDGYVDCGTRAHGAWDYLGGLLVCQEAGASVADANGEGLVVRTHGERRSPVAGGTTQLQEALVEARRFALATSG
ncbi:MAG: inositol monophosphatase/fructose,6-bisphosphatase family protein [Acidimicrobiaceae bacterium]|nr:inositol monophosphatase/fructose,6-bisphosphatase family protein [Acidimicrobiaceae bacterium]